MHTHTPSTTMATYPIVTALVKAEGTPEPQSPWRAVNRSQARFLSEFFVPCRQESLSIPEIESIASLTAEEINRFLRERGFRIQLKPFGPRGFGVASVLDMLVDWWNPGEETEVRGQDGAIYPAVRLEVGCSFSQAMHHNYPIVELMTTSRRDRVYLTRVDEALAAFELLSSAQQFQNTLKPTDDYRGVVFPMVDLNQQVDIRWLIGLSTTDVRGQEIVIEQAFQETHLAMNQEGARARSGVAIGLVGGLSRWSQPDLIIDGPFLVWFRKSGLSKPLFAGYITPEDWKKPVSVSLPRVLPEEAS